MTAHNRAPHPTAEDHANASIRIGRDRWRSCDVAMAAGDRDVCWSARECATCRPAARPPGHRGPRRSGIRKQGHRPHSAWRRQYKSCVDRKPSIREATCTRAAASGIGAASSPGITAILFFAVRASLASAAHHKGARRGLQRTKAPDPRRCSCSMGLRGSISRPGERVTRAS
jgi:hypothetical protein